MNGVPWDNEEIAVLRAIYPSGGKQAVSKALGTRSTSAVAMKARQLGIRCTDDRKTEVRKLASAISNCPWTDEQVSVLTARYPYEGATAVANAIGRTPESVKRKASRLNIKCTTEVRSRLKRRGNEAADREPIKRPPPPSIADQMDRFRRASPAERRVIFAQAMDQAQRRSRNV